MSDIPVESGIYKITCIVNGRFYIGSAVNLRKRKNNHWHSLRQNKHYNLPMQRAWNKYGEQAFIFEVWELVLVPELLTTQEQYWIEKLTPFGHKGFNIRRKAESNLGLKHSLKTLERMKQSNNVPGIREKKRHVGNKYALGNRLSPEHCEIIKQAQMGNKNHLGRKDSFKTREKKSQSHLGNKSHLGQECPLEVREKISQASKGKPKSLETRERMKQAWIKRKEKTGAA